MLVTIAIALALAGIAGIYLRLRGEFPPSVTTTTLVLIAGATPLAWYAAIEPSISDLSVFAVTAACAGTLGATRRTAALPNWLKSIVWLGLSLTPLIGIWWTTDSSAGLDLAGSRWLEVLFSSWHGFLSWTPVAYVAVVGTLLYARRDWRWAAVSVALLFLSSWLIGASAHWREPAFGGRVMLPVLVLLAPGLAYLSDLARRHPVVALTPLVALALLWNHLLMIQYTIGMLPKDEPVSFARLVRQQADLQPRVMPAYPFAFPANLWFAWRQGVPVDRYDLLSMEPRRPSIDLAFDRSAERLLLDGWTGPTAEGEQSGWWIGEREASVVLPIEVGGARMWQVTVVARTRYEEPVMIADLAVRLNDQEIGTFSPAATEASEARFTVPASALRDGFNKVTILSRGARRADTSDPRSPGPLARRSGRAPWPVAVYRIAIAPL